MKALSVLAGVGLTVVLYFGLAYYGNEPSTGGHDMRGAYIGTVTVIPVLIFLGSMLTGFLIEPSLKKSWLAFLFYSPGMSFVVILTILSCTCFIDPKAGIWDLLMYGGIVVTWLLPSWLAVALGYKLRTWIGERVSRRF
jgi:hypothetical protein